MINIQHCRDSKSTAELKKKIIIIIRSNVDNFYSCEVSVCVCVCVYIYVWRESEGQSNASSPAWGKVKGFLQI